MLRITRENQYVKEKLCDLEWDGNERFWNDETEKKRMLWCYEKIACNRNMQDKKTNMIRKLVKVREKWIN